MREIWLGGSEVAIIIEEEGYAEAELVATLEAALGSFPFGREWLALVREGYTAEEARLELGLSRRWLAEARMVCAKALCDG